MRSMIKAPHAIVPNMGIHIGIWKPWVIFDLSLIQTSDRFTSANTVKIKVDVNAASSTSGRASAKMPVSPVATSVARSGVLVFSLMCDRVLGSQF